MRQRGWRSSRLLLLKRRRRRVAAMARVLGAPPAEGWGTSLDPAGRRLARLLRPARRSTRALRGRRRPAPTLRRDQRRGPRPTRTHLTQQPRLTTAIRGQGRPVTSTEPL